MPEENKTTGGVLADISANLSGIFRHMLPGALLVGAARIAHPDWFLWVQLGSWQHLSVLAVLTVAVGNTWFGLNRYGLHQLFDFVLYLIGSKGPAISTECQYLDDLGRYTYKSLHTPETSSHARSHVAFRASTVLLILTVGEADILFSLWHAPNSELAVYPLWVLWVCGGAALLIGFWQMVITRHIDFYVVNPPQ